MDKITGKGDHTSVESLLGAFHEASRVSDKSGYFACFNSPESRFLGTDAQENWTVREFYDFAGPYFDKAKAEGKAAWEYTPIIGSRKVDILGNIAYFDEIMTSVSFRATTRGNGVAIRNEEGRWSLLQYHLSFPIPNPLAHSFCAVIADWETKEKENVGEGAGEDAEKALIDVLLKRRKESLSGRK